MSAKILLISNYAPDHQESMQRFAEVLSRALTERDCPHKLWRPPFILGRIFKSPRLKKLTAYLDKFVLGVLSLLFYRLCHRNVVFHILDHGNSVYSFFLPSRKTLITCHDCIAIQEASLGITGERVSGLGRMLQSMIVHALVRATDVVAVSGKTAADLRQLGVDSADIIHNSVYSSVAKVSDREIRAVMTSFGFAPDMEFIFMLGSNLNRKNRLRAMQAFSLFKERHGSDLKLLLAGSPVEGSAKDYLEQSAHGHDIHYLGAVDDKVLSALYSACRVFLFPSLAEGFGVPIIEAQSCGAVVVTSLIEPMPEVAGSGAVFVDPYQIDDLCRGIETALGSHEAVMQAGLMNAKRFSVEGMTQKYFRKYQEMGAR